MTTNQTPSNTQMKPNFKRWLLIFLVAITPSLVSYLLITLNGDHVSDFLPNFSDEVSYWNQINTFRVAGLNGGYFTINELAPAASFTHFYTYGPWYPALYGAFTFILGGYPTTLLLLNALLVGLALALFCIVVQLDLRQLCLTALMLSISWGLLLYLFTGMQEAYQQAIAIILASLLVIALRKGEAATLQFKILGLVLITFATLMRLSWAIFFLPFLAFTGKKTFRYWLFYVFVTLILTATVMVIANYTGAPGNNSVFDMVSAFRSSLGEGISYLVRYLIHNLGRFLLLPKPGTDVLQTYEVVAVILALVAFSIQLFLHWRRKSPLRTEVLFHLYNLGITVLAACALYIIGTGGDYRLLACHLMVSLLVAIACKRYRPVLLFVVANLLFITVFLGDFRSAVLTKYDPDHTAYTTFKQVTDAYMPYDAHETNAWCNTLLFSVHNYDGQSLDGTSAGIGLSFFKDPEEPLLTFKSRYLLLSTDDYQAITQRSNAPQLEHLADSPIGSLYLNKNVSCSKDSASNR